jgi:hypothetical protein
MEHGVTEFELIVGSKPLCVQMQYGKPTMWMMVPIKEPQTERRRFMWITTGSHIPLDAAHLIYIGTIQLENGAFVHHLFEVLK